MLGFVRLMSESLSGRITANSGLTLRERPGKEYPKVSIIPWDAQVEVLDTSGPIEIIKGKKSPWFKLSYQGKEGWAFGYYITTFPNQKSSLEEDFRIRLYSAWLKLGESKNHCSDTFDYFPDGGMRIFYCHIKEFMDYEFLSRYLTIPIFKSGPHSRFALNLNATHDFGHYNPEFVLHIRKLFLPALKNPFFLRMSTSIYNQYIKKLAETFEVTYKVLESNPSYKKGELDAYTSHLQTSPGANFDYEKYYYFLSKTKYANVYDGNVVKTCVAFWLRRNLDGTASEFYEGLRELMNLYNAGIKTKN